MQSPPQRLFLGALKTHSRAELELSSTPLGASSRRRGEDRISLCSVLCFPTRICQREMKASLQPSHWEWEQAGRGETAPNLFVLFCFWCLHMLPELVNHIGSPGYHSILTKWWYLLNFVCSQNCWAVPAEWVLLSFSFFSRERVGANTSILSNYIIERECISFLHLMASNISPNSLKLRNTLSFNFSYHFHFFHVL